MTTLTVSVVICAFSDERWGYLQAAVESVRRQHWRAHEIVVVVDHNERLMRLARDHMSDVRVLENSGERGAASARNCGVAAATGDVIAFLDDDAVASPDWLAKITAAHSNPRVLGVGGRLRPRWLREPPAWFPDEFAWVVGCTYTGMPQSASPVRNLIAANMSVRRHVFTSVRGFREGFGNVKGNGKAGGALLRATFGDEETEFCIRAQEQWPEGYWLYEPAAEAFHTVPATRGRFRYYLRRCLDEGLGKAQLSRLHGGKVSLSSERAYTTRVLPRGVANGITSWLRHGETAGLKRACAIVLGLAATVTGYATGASVGLLSSLSRR